MYALFVGDNYYPSGGWDDFHGMYNTVEDAKTDLIQVKCDWWQIVDLSNGVMEQWGHG